MDPTSIVPDPLILLCMGPCRGEFYLPLDEDEATVCPNDREHPVAVYRLVVASETKP